MNCQEFLDRYSDYDDSLLLAPELDRFRSHMAECESCARYDRVLRKGRMLARQLPPVRPGEDFIPRLNQRVRFQHRERRPSSAILVLGGAAGALAGVTVLLTSFWAVSLMFESAPATAADLEPTAAPGPSAWAWSPAGGGAVLGSNVANHGGAAFNGWSVQRVDHHVSSTYSPLVTGPPAFRLTGALPHAVNVSPSTLHTLD